MKLIIFATLVLCLAVNADVLGKINGVGEKIKEAIDFSHDWNALKVSWWADPRWGFDKLPRTLAENNGDFELKDDQCATGGGKFVGQRYWHKKDPALILLFDKNGIIAGVQTSSLKANFTPYAKMINKNYIDDGDFWTLTAYFVDPSKICSEGRTTEQLLSEGTGTGLWLQQGPTATNSIKIPMTETEMRQTKWGYGKCFPTMGQHYWYNVSKDMDCDDFVPNCILYNHGKLTAFCFAKNNLDYSTPLRYKYGYDNPAPKNTQLHLFLNPVPDCFFKEASYKVASTMHFYFIESPKAASWCI
jgi:charged multivesicular body protein 7